MQNKQNSLSDAANESQATQAISESARVIDLNAPGIASQVSKRILADIDAYCVKTYDDGHRKHLGASLIGHECKRYLWYVFRWCMHKKFDGRMQRLFNRGHREEARFIEWLEGIGCEVYSHDADGNQFRVNACGGHFGGSLDAIIKLPAHYGIPGYVLGEFKTNGTGAAFTELTKSGMAKNKAMHYAQTSTYGSRKEYGFQWCLYLNINKNDDSIHCEIVKLDWNLGEQMVMKAEQIIIAQEPPPRLSNNATFKSCAYCDFKPICHEGKPVERNCRSCKSASARDLKQWFCEVHNAIIPDEVISQGCPQHQSININA